MDHFWGCLDLGQPWIQIQLALNIQGPCTHCVAWDTTSLCFPLARAKFVLPRRGMMEDMERYYDIKKGTIPQHDNLLAISKPEDP